MCGCSGQVSGTGPTDTSVENPPSGNCPTSNVWEHTTNPWLLNNPEVTIVFWGGWWATNSSAVKQQATMSAGWNAMLADPNFFTPLSQYGIGEGYLTNIFNANATLNSGTPQITDDYIQGELRSEITNGILPASDLNSVYVIMLPAGVQSSYDVQNNFGGHHGHTDTGFIVYSVIENGNYTNMDITTSHEIYESSTNPDTSNGWWGPGGETEVADLCQGNYYNLDGYKIQQVWSQTACACGPTGNVDAPIIDASAPDGAVEGEEASTEVDDASADDVETSDAGVSDDASDAEPDCLFGLFGKNCKRLTL